MDVREGRARERLRTRNVCVSLLHEQEGSEPLIKFARRDSLDADFPRQERKRRNVDSIFTASEAPID